MTYTPTVVYAYFRFFSDKDTIAEGLEKFCNEWSALTSSGYNYLEYKCYTTNPGGFNLWVSEMSGYLKAERESGFIDGAPSDSLYDSGLTMGKMKKNLPNLELLNAYTRPFNLIVRKLTAESVGAGKLDYNVGGVNNITHPLYVCLDSTTIERFVITGEITDLSTNLTSMSGVVDLSIDSIQFTHDVANTTMTDPEKAYNGNYADYASGVNNDLYIDLGSIQPLHNVTYKYYLSGSSSNMYIYLYYGDTIAGCNNLIDSDFVSNTSKTETITTYRHLGVNARYLCFRFMRVGSSGVGRLFGMEIG